MYILAIYINRLLLVSLSLKGCRYVEMKQLCAVQYYLYHGSKDGTNIVKTSPSFLYQLLFSLHPFSSSSYSSSSYFSLPHNLTTSQIPPQTLILPFNLSGCSLIHIFFIVLMRIHYIFGMIYMSHNIGS